MGTEYGKENITETEIHEKLAKRYDGKKDGFSMGRKMHRFKHKDSYGRIGTIMYTLDGSPPKGFAVYVPECKELHFYEIHGDCFKRYNNIHIKDDKGKILF